MPLIAKEQPRNPKDLQRDHLALLSQQPTGVEPQLRWVVEEKVEEWLSQPLMKRTHLLLRC